MRPWRHKFQVKDLLTTRDVSPASARDLGRKVAERLEAVTFPFHQHTYLADLFRQADDQEEFNGCMKIMYDLADEQRIWVG